MSNIYIRLCLFIRLCEMAFRGAFTVSIKDNNRFAMPADFLKEFGESIFFVLAYDSKKGNFIKIEKKFEIDSLGINDPICIEGKIQRNNNNKVYLNKDLLGWLSPDDKIEELTCLGRGDYVALTRLSLKEIFEANSKKENF